MKAFSKWFGRLPFAGKIALRQLLFLLYFSQNKAQRIRAYVKLLGLIAFYTWGHGLQVLLGYVALYFVPAWLTPACFAYMAVNALVVVMHFYLLGRATVFALTNSYDRSKSNYIDLSGREKLIAFGFTMACQTIFMIIYLGYQK